MTTQVLHIDFVTLSPEAGAAARADVLSRAAALTEIEAIIEAAAIVGGPGSDFELALYFLLPNFEALEPFGTDPRYVRFLQGTVARYLHAFAGADVRLEWDFPGTTKEYAVCVALAAPPETYDWEIKERLESWAAELEGEAVIGVAAGERQHYRGLAIVFVDGLPAKIRHAMEGADLTLAAGRLQRFV